MLKQHISDEFITETRLYYQSIRSTDTWRGGFELMCRWMICVSSADEGRKCVWADVNSAAWISVRTLKPLCVGNMRARAKLRGEMSISNCPWLFSMSELSTHITKPPLFTGTNQNQNQNQNLNQNLNLNQSLNLDPAVCPLRATGQRKILFISKECVHLTKSKIHYQDI